METKLVKLRFKSPVHFGAGRLSDSQIACDAATLFSALYIEALRIGVEEELLSATESEDLLLSDVFPFVGDTLYIPKPMVQFNVVSATRPLDKDEGSRARKAAKKLSFIPARELSTYLRGTLDPVATLDQFHVGCAGVQTKVNLLRDETVDAMPYVVGGFSFLPEAGLYFIVRGSFDLAPLLDLLSFSGLGGKRTAGYGRFSYEICEGSAFPPLAEMDSYHPTRSMLLSTSTPTNGELSSRLLDGARYRLVRKGGFEQSAAHGNTPQRKRDLYEFVAGSVFSHTFRGDVFDVNDTDGAHPVYRYARAMWLEV